MSVCLLFNGGLQSQQQVVGVSMMMMMKYYSAIPSKGCPVLLWSGYQVVLRNAVRSRGHILKLRGCCTARIMVDTGSS
jgi:hypothetical protein